MIDWRKWKHVTKLDPDKPITEKGVAAVVDSGTDAIMVSGTQDITEDNVSRLMGMLREYRIPKVLEPAGTEALCDDLDLLFIPSVLNANNIFWTVGCHKLWVQHYSIDWERVVPEAYIVLNPDSAVARATWSKTGQTPQDAAAYAVCADRFFHFPVVYLEYSGMYGEPKLVQAVKGKLHGSRLFYSGGIDSQEKAEEMAKYADTIVVGNLVYESGGIEKLKETII